MLKKIGRRSIIAGICMALLVCGFSTMASEPAKSLDVLFVHDTHSHLNEFATVAPM